MRSLAASTCPITLGVRLARARGPLGHSASAEPAPTSARDRKCVVFPPDHDIARAPVGFIDPLVDRTGAALLYVLLRSVGETGSANGGVDVRRASRDMRARVELRNSTVRTSSTCARLLRFVGNATSEAAVRARPRARQPSHRHSR